MAEEEILQETAPEKKKDKGGGFSLVHIIIIAVILVIGTAVTTLVIKSNVNKLGQGIKDDINVLKQGQRTQGRLPDLQRIEPCDPDHIVEVREAKEPLIVNLADGEHYLSLTFAVCIDDKMDVADFEAKLPMVLHVTNELLSTYTKNDFFGTGGADQMKAETPEGELDLGGMEETDQGFVGAKDRVRMEIINAFAKRDMPFVKDIYFTSFLVQ